MAGVIRKAVLGVGLALLAVGPASAQSLDEVDRHLREGRVEEARAALLAWERATPRPDRIDRQRGLWLRGLMTLDPTQAASSYMRLVVEYPGGPFTDRALLRLAQAAELRGELDEAAEHYTRLSRDHPASPLGDDAREWLRAHPGRVAEDRSAPDRAEAGGPEARIPAPPDSDDGVFAVQLGAFSAADGARSLADRARDAGFEVRTVQVRGDPFFRVRVGRFEDRSDAELLRDRIRAAGFEATLSANAHEERGRG